MKRIFWSMLLLLAGFSGALTAAEATAGVPTANAKKWDVLQIGFVPGAPTDTATTPVYGIRIGAPICAGAPVIGVEAAVFYAGSAEVSGFQGCLIMTEAKRITGLQLAPVNFVEDCAGLQLGIFNFAEGKTFQIGILNYIKDAPVPFLPIVNFKF